MADAVVIGSGINSLACAALLARGGWNVRVLEREDELGGCIRTAALTEPGYLHDVFSAWHPLWVGGAAHAELADALGQRGLEYLNTDYPTATLTPEGEATFLLRSTEANVAELGEEWRGAVEFTGNVLASSRDWLTQTFASGRAHGVLAPWVLHTGLGPDAAGSGFMTQVIAVAVQEGGMPIPRGGGAKLVEALVRLIEDHGGTCEAGRDVERVLVRDGKASGVRLADGEEVAAERAVIANVTPTQLYGRLVEGHEELGSRFRYGRSEMQIHFALSEPPRWEGDERLGQTAIVHLTPGLDGVSRAVNEAERGLLPAEATVVVGQPLTIDPSRAPDGAGLLWIQLQELPWHVKDDAAGELATGDGTWTEDLRERYADRIQARIARHVPNLESSIRKRVTLSPADLQAANVNLHQGDPYSGALELDQNLLWRPLPSSPGHATPVDRLWHIGASTHPGPGLGAGSGTLVAKRLLRGRLPWR